MKEVVAASSSRSAAPPGWVLIRAALVMLIAALLATSWFIFDVWGAFCIVAGMAIEPAGSQGAYRGLWALRSAVVLAGGACVCSLAALWMTRGRYRAVSLIALLAAGTYVAFYLIARTGWSPAGFILRWMGHPLAPAV